MMRITLGAVVASTTIANNGLGTAAFSGVILPRTVSTLGAATLNGAAGKGARGMIYRLERAVIACGLKDMRFYELLSIKAKRLPLAFVVREADLELYRRAVCQGGRAGLVRGAFTDATSAEAWVLDEMAMAAQVAAMRTAANPPHVARQALVTRDLFDALTGGELGLFCHP